MFSIPYLALDVLTAIFIADQTPLRSDDLFLIRTSLTIKDKNFGGTFMFFPDVPSVDKIFKALGVEKISDNTPPPSDA